MQKTMKCRRITWLLASWRHAVLEACRATQDGKVSFLHLEIISSTTSKHLLSRSVEMSENGVEGEHQKFRFLTLLRIWRHVHMTYKQVNIMLLPTGKSLENKLGGNCWRWRSSFKNHKSLCLNKKWTIPKQIRVKVLYQITSEALLDGTRSFYDLLFVRANVRRHFVGGALEKGGSSFAFWVLICTFMCGV